MALFSECSLECASKLLDTADIVREAIFQQLSAKRRAAMGLLQGSTAWSRLPRRYREVCGLAERRSIPTLPLQLELRMSYSTARSSICRPRNKPLSESRIPAEGSSDLRQSANQSF